MKIMFLTPTAHLLYPQCLLGAECEQAFAVCLDDMELPRSRNGKPSASLQ